MVLISIYEEQTGWDILARMRSDPFKITIGATQGSVISLVLLSMYLDDLLTELQLKLVGNGYWLVGHSSQHQAEIFYKECLKYVKPMLLSII